MASSPSQTTAARKPLIAKLRHQIAQQESPQRHFTAEIVSTGSQALDELLPARGLRPGSIVEYLSTSTAAGAATLALIAGETACRQDRLFIVVDRQKTFYPLTAATWGVDLNRLILLRPNNDCDEIWALDQSLRCPGVGAVWAACGHLDPRDYRRLQLAAECSGAVGLFLRSSNLRGSPTWADVQWLVEPLPGDGSWQLKVTLLRCRGGSSGRTTNLKLDESAKNWRKASDRYATHPVLAFSSVADSTAPSRRSGA